MKLVWVCVAGCAALIVGCSPKVAGTADAGGNATATATASAGAPAANAAAAPAAASADAAGGALAAMPTPKAGLWKRVSTQDGGAPETSTKCLDGGPINPMEGGPSCPNANAQSTPKGFIFDGDCANNGMDAKIHMTGSGDYDASFTTDATMSMTGGPGPAMTTKNHSVWTYVGACPK